MGGENWQQNAPQKWDCWAQCAPACDPCFLTWFKTRRQADGTWFWEGKKSQKITKWGWEKAKCVCVSPHHNRMRCTSRSPHFSVQHPLKAQTWPKASPKLYPVIILPFSNKRELGFFGFFLTTGLRHNTSAEQFFTTEDVISIVTTPPRLLPDGFLGKTHGVQAMPAFLRKRDAESPPFLFNDEHAKRRQGKTITTFLQKTPQRVFLWIVCPENNFCTLFYQNHAICMSIMGHYPLHYVSVLWLDSLLCFFAMQ